MKASLPSLATLLPLLLTGNLAAASLTIPYTNDFTGPPDNGPLDNSVQFTLDAGEGVYQAEVGTNAGGQVAYASNQFSALVGASFTAHTVVSFENFSGAGQSFGIPLFGMDSAFTGAVGSPYLLADYSRGDGTVRILSVSGTPTVLDSAAAVAISTETPYLLLTDVTFLSDSDYQISVGLYNPETMTLIGAAASAVYTVPLAEPSGGYYLGLRARSPNAGITTVNFHEFAVIPEPSTWMLGILGGLALVIFRRLRIRAD